MQKLLFTAALALGGLIGYIDSRPTWDDTSITAAVLFITSGVFGFLGPKRPWLWALALGIWIPILGLARVQNGWIFLVLVVAFLGAYGGSGLRRLLFPIRT